MTSKTGLCKDFKGDRPCKNYWVNDKHNCFDKNSPLYDEFDKRILLIKLDALGDVVRCTPLAEGLKKKYPKSKLIWLTQKNCKVFLGNNKFIDEIVTYSDENIRILLSQKFDLTINLDKDAKATSIIKNIISSEKLGYSMSDSGHPIPINQGTNYHYEICLDNWGKKQNNKKTYIEMMFDACEIDYEDERMFIYSDEEELKNFKEDFNRQFNIENKKLIILNTGCGPVYPHKKWHFDGYVKLIDKLLKDDNLKIILTGGESELKINHKLLFKFKSNNIIDTTNTLSLKKFKNLINISDILVSGDTLALHLGIAFKKKIITFFGPTPYQETDLFGLGKKFVRKELECLSCHDQFPCPWDGRCMTDISSSDVHDEIKKMLYLK